MNRNNWDFFYWLGWKNPNTCLARYFNSNGNGINRNVGMTVLPLRFWRHVGFGSSYFGFDNIRNWIGLGVFSIFWDRPIGKTSAICTSDHHGLCTDSECPIHG